jgi:hypothetical protein
VSSLSAINPNLGFLAATTGTVCGLVSVYTRNL